jgi:hypothetical protein
MPSLFRRSDFGPGRAMHGGDLDREIHFTSDLDDNQGTRTMEYYQIAQMLAPINEALKSLAAKTANVAGRRPADGYAAAAEKALSKARRAMIKAQSDDDEDRDGETDEELLAEVDRCLARAKKLLLQAHEADEPEEAVEDAAAGLRKARLTRAGMIARPTPAAAAAAKSDAGNKALTKATAELDRQCETVKNGLAEIVGLLAKRNGGQPAPMSHIMAKASTGPEIPSNHQIEQMLEGGHLTSAAAMEAKMLRSILHQGGLEEAKDRIKKSPHGGVRMLFDAFK